MLPELVQRLGTTGQRDFGAVVGVLTTANTIFKRYRESYDNNELRKSLKLVLDTFVAPLLALLKAKRAQVQARQPGLKRKAPPVFNNFFFNLNEDEAPLVSTNATKFHNLNEKVNLLFQLEPGSSD